MAGFLINAASFIIPGSIEIKDVSKVSYQSTAIQIITGSSGDNPQVGDPKSCGGSVPHIAIWDNWGNRLGQFHPDSDEVMPAGDPRTYSVPQMNLAPGEDKKKADYVMLSNLENDAICIAAVTVGNDDASVTFYGDTGYTCGQSWFLSEHEVGPDSQKPKCVWLDADHSNGINARALSFHVDDMEGDQDKIDEYQKDRATLCDSTPRFSFWGNLLPDGEIPFFKPVLQYKLDSGNNKSQGADVDPKRVIDKPGQYDKSVYLNQGEKTKRKAKISRQRIKASGANRNPGHLIITKHPHDDVREVCEHPNSHGWDIASTAQSVYCDMENKQLYRICDGHDFQDNCFDLFTKQIVPKDGSESQDELSDTVPKKHYTSVAQWE